MTTATPKELFRRLKTYLRNTTRESRLKELATLKIFIGILQFQQMLIENQKYQED